MKPVPQRAVRSVMAARCGHEVFCGAAGAPPLVRALDFAATGAGILLYTLWKTPVPARIVGTIWLAAGLLIYRIQRRSGSGPK